MSEYQPKEIEVKWQKYWEKNSTFKVGEPGDKKKFYCLDMFPYPSGAGLHVGHPLGYTATDIYSRFKRMQGYAVLHPMGYDAFGLPAEQHALNTGEHPSLVTKANCSKFTQQMKRIGLSYDWDREIASCNADYYHWTQWIFLKLYNSWFDEETQRSRPIAELVIPSEIQKKGELAIQEYQALYRLAYYADAMVNWCPALGTVLANEEVIDGKSERGGHDVIRRPMKQWMLRITKYSERLLSELEDIDWPENIKEQQRNWIGRKTGTEIQFELPGSPETLITFTTRPDTLFGVTFVVISPEHPAVEILTTAAQKAKVLQYKEEASKLSEFTRILDNRKKTGVATGGHVINPLNGEKVPVFVADYVIMSYGTGAVMGVPAHDDRDFDFARAFGISVVPVIRPNAKDSALVEKVVSGNACWTGEGTMLDLSSPRFSELSLAQVGNREAGERITHWLVEHEKGSKVVNYKLRDWLFSRQRYWGEPIPIIHWDDGRVTALTEGDLPLVLPEVADYKPSENGESPLAKATEWLKITDPQTGKTGRRETNVMPQWAGSCWYYLRFADPKNEQAPWDPKIEKSWMPVDLYVGGAEHAVLHLLYARFWHKVLYDLGYVSTKEPFQKLYNQGMIVAHAYKDKRGAILPTDQVEEKPDGTYVFSKTGEKVERITAKMSKSLKNVVDPIEIIDLYGADTLRMYLMFMGPLDAMRPWDSKAIMGNHRFLRRAWNLVTDKLSQGLIDGDSPEMTKLLHKTIRKVTDDVEGLRFNTSISALMEFVNGVGSNAVTRNMLEAFVLLLSPFAPHVAEELWEQLGHTKTLSYEAWPKADDRYLVEESVSVVIQVQGKKRGLIEVDATISEDDLKQSVLQALQGGTYTAKSNDKFITVFQPGTKRPKLVNVIPTE